MFVCFGQVLVGSACTACLFALVMVGWIMMTMQNFLIFYINNQISQRISCDHPYAGYIHENYGICII